MVAHFVDLKAVFDMIHREVLCKTMRRRRIREGLVERVKEARETKNKVRTGRETGGEFLDGKDKKEMSIECDVIQYNNIGLGGGNGKGEVRRDKAGGGKGYIHWHMQMM